MDYTTSPDYDTQSGKRLHKDSGPIDTVWSAKDANQVIWSLMNVLEAAGISAASFDPTDVSTYNRLTAAIRKLAGDRQDYTPVLKFGGNNAGMAFSSSFCRTQQVGSIVHFCYFVQLSAKGSSTGQATFELQGAPDPMTGNVRVACEVNAMATTLPGDPYGFVIGSGGSAAGELRVFNPATGLFVQLTDAHFTNASSLYLSGSYLIA